jgi:rhodanese-related sulfurtransferase
MQQQIEFYKEKLAFEIDSSDLWEALQNNQEIVVLDTRQPAGYKKEHIPTAINIPHKEMNVQSTKHLDKSKSYVTYCDGIGCNASTKGALKMAKLGFKTKELIGGINWWKFDGYATEGSHPSQGLKIKCSC